MDQLLSENSALMRGLVVDIGGKKRNRRGSFMPPEGNGTRWIYLNIDIEVAPDVIGNAEILPLKSNSVDCVVCCEVLEHIKHPERCCAEMFRILKPGGVLILSVPFLYPLHGDPNDYTRFTPDALRDMCKGFENLTIIPMGGWLGTVGMLSEISKFRQKDGAFSFYQDHAQKRYYDAWVSLGGKQSDMHGTIC